MKPVKTTATGSTMPCFEDTTTGRLKRQIWEASDKEIDSILADYGIPAPSEWGRPGCYIQTTVRHEVEARRAKNDVVIIPVGCTELHGPHTVSSMDTLFVSMIAEGVRRYTAKRGAPVSLALPPLMYGCHPYHHLGMAGTVIIREEVAKEFMIDVMLGLWNDGFRKQIILNNHGQLWVLEAALQQFCKRYQLPGIYRVMDWHRATREFFTPDSGAAGFESNFIHADEHETSVGLLLFPDMVHMQYAVDTAPKGFLPAGHFGDSVDSAARPSRWSEGEGHAPIEIAGTPVGIVGKATAGDARKAKRGVAAILKYVTLVADEMLEAFPAGTVPATELVSLRDPEELQPYLRTPMSPGWKSVYGLPPMGS